MKEKIGADNWLHIISHALTNYVAEGGTLTLRQSTAGVQLVFIDILADDSRLHPKFQKLMAEQQARAPQ